MISAGSYLLSTALLAAVAASLGFSAVRVRRRLMPEWEGAPAHLVEAVLGVALLIWLSELLGTFGLFYAWALVGASLSTAAGIYWWTASRAPVGDGEVSPAGGMGLGGSRTPPPAAPPQTHDRPRGPELLMSVIAVGVVATVFAHWGLTTKDALDRGIFNFDSLWYHMPFAVEMVQSHSVTGLHYTETVFTNWFYPQNSELLHAVGILLTERDTLSLFLNFGWLTFAFLAAWCIGRPYGRGQLSVVAAAVVLECHTLVVREPGAAKNDLIAASLLVAGTAILVNAWPRRRGRGARDVADLGAPSGTAGGRGALEPGWPLAAAGLAIGLAAGTKVTVLAMAAALSVAVIVLAPAAKRWAAAGWWFLPAFAGGGFWYLRNLIVAGNPLPQVERLGPISLPHPELVQSGRPDFSIAHYATDTGVWREYFGPGLEQAFGALWPLVVALALAGALLALLGGGDRVVRWSGGVALFGMLAYLFTPLGAAGAEGAPDGFAINIRFAIPALLLGAVLLPLAPIFAEGESPPRSSSTFSTLWRGKSRQWLLLGVLLALVLVSDRADAVLRDPSRLFGLGVAFLFVLVPAALLLARRQGASRGVVAAGFAVLAVAVVAIGYPLQRDYLDDRFARGSDIPGMDLEAAYEWARERSDARVGLAGTSAGFLQYGFYGTDLSNRVRYLGQKGPHGAFNAIPTCGGFRAAVNAANLDYLVTAPFLNFIHTGDPIPSPESRWLRGESAVRPIERNGPVAIWRVEGELDPAACGPRNAPLREVPQQPRS